VNNIKPHYDQKNFDPKNRENKLQLIVSPEKESEGVLDQPGWQNFI